jgi:CBS domain containing-hemolysin-like protein
LLADHPPTGSEPLTAAVDWSQVDLEAIALGALALALAGGTAALRRSLAQSVPERVLAPVADPARREALERPLRKVDRLATSAALLELVFTLLFIVAALWALADGARLTWRSVGGALLVCVPVLWFATDALARGIALRAGDPLLRAALPAFHVLQLPLEALTWSFEAVRRGLLRLFGLHDDPETTRQIVAGLREVIEDAEISGRLDESEKEIIGNVMEFRDVDVAAVMTPRTKLVAADVDEGLLEAAKKLAGSGHSRVPVYEGTPDTILGTVSARDIVQVLAAGKLDETDLRSVMHPAFFVPETKRIRELLGELRRAKTELAIVLDEYGGTAGLVTIGDIVGEIVGEIPDEYDEDQPASVRHLPGGAAEVDATLHVSEVNELFELDLPEEADFETLGGFVLAQLGRFPQRGESFQRGDVVYTVADASDRRVLKVRLRKLAAAAAE